jgi:rod shape-determining protein MreD
VIEAKLSFHYHSSQFSMPQLKIAAALAVAIILQLSLGGIWPPLSYIDFPLVVVVYIALQRHAWHALMVGTIAGLAIDAPSRGLIGAGGFSKTLTAYLIYIAATRVNLENPLLRIPVLAAATLIDSTIYFFWHRSLGYPPSMPFVQTISYRLIGTTIVGTFALYLLDSLFTERARQRRTFASRRKGARRGPSTLRRR